LDNVLFGRSYVVKRHLLRQCLYSVRPSVGLSVTHAIRI